MKYVFIINPASGANMPKDFIEKEINSLNGKYDILLHYTSAPNEATSFIKEYLKNNDGEFRFIACGGDGTINEVANGIYGYENASMTAYPCGSGDDFVKSVGGIEKHKSVENLILAKNHKIDLIKVNDKLCINVCNFGFDAEVVKYAIALKGKKKNPYKAGILKALFTSMKNDIKVEVDGEILNNEKKLLLCTLANGGYEGGQYFCAPKYKVDDGLIEVCYVKTVSVFKFLRLVGAYEKGLHLDDKRFEKYLIYKRSKKIKVFSKNDFSICIDGELIIGKEFNVEVLPLAINYAFPD